MTQNKKITVAIDGYSSSGKSTMAKALARAVGYKYIDSGAMYRAVTLYALRHGEISDGSLNTSALIASLPDISISFDVDALGNSRTMLNGEDVESEIRDMEVSEWVSPVAAVPEVRHFLVREQKRLGAGGGIVMDGRDIGTTVFPHAEMKVFVNASPEVRANRRLKEMLAKGEDVDYREVYDNICRRDEIDRTRKESPLRKASDALELDNDNMSLTEQEAWLLARFREAESAEG